jgi:hypothetical protein
MLRAGAIDDRLRLASMCGGSSIRTGDGLGPKNYLSRFPSQVGDAVLGGNAERFWNFDEGLHKREPSVPLS